MPVQNVNINNVSMDYFLRGVEAAQPKNAPQVPLQTDEVTVQKSDGKEKHIGGDIAKAVNELYCPSLLTRDELPKIFK